MWNTYLFPFWWLFWLGGEIGLNDLHTKSVVNGCCLTEDANAEYVYTFILLLFQCVFLWKNTVYKRVSLFVILNIIILNTSKCGARNSVHKDLNVLFMKPKRYLPFISYCCVLDSKWLIQFDQITNALYTMAQFPINVYLYEVYIIPTDMPLSNVNILVSRQCA